MTATNRILLTLFVLITVGCDTPSSRIAQLPTRPSAASPPPAVGPRLSGVVTDSALRPLDGARIEVLDGAEAGHSGITDARGLFELDGRFAGARLRATVAGHLAAEITVSGDCSVCGVTIRMASERPAIDMTGRYRLTLSADPSCTEPSGDLSRRTFVATVARGASNDGPPNTVFTATVDNASLVAGYRTFSIHTAADYVAFVLRGQLGQPALVEQVAASEFLAFSGSGGVATTQGAPTISSAFDGFLHRCQVPGPFSWDGCDVAPGHGGCSSTRNALVLERQ